VQILQHAPQTHQRASGVDLKEIAMLTPDFSGSDLVNEA